MGARVAGELARRYRGHPLPPDTLRLGFFGSAGQSFGAFCVEGMSLHLEGEANDGVGKGMSGGEIVLRPLRDRGRVGVAGRSPVPAWVIEPDLAPWRARAHAADSTPGLATPAIRSSVCASASRPPTPPARPLR